MKPGPALKLRWLGAGLALLLAACGSSSLLTAGIGGTGIVFGTITGFGSVLVNGGRYETGSSQFVVDGDSSATQADLRVGMVVRLEVPVEEGELTSDASRIVYADLVQGPVAAMPEVVPGTGGSQKIFQVFGQTITIDSTSTVFVGTGFGALGTDDLIEVSGFRSSATTIDATYVERVGELVPGVSEIELYGAISAHDPDAGEFIADGVLIRYDATTEIDVEGGLQNETLVSVEGVIQVDGSVQAEEIEDAETGIGEDVGEISMQGVIAQYSNIADFFINGQPVDASAASLTPANAASLLKNGLNVEVEGDIIDGVLIADELEIREGEAGLAAYIVPGSVDTVNQTFSVGFASLPGAVLVIVDGQTILEDEAGGDPLANLTLADLAGGDYVLIDGREIEGELHAAVVKRTDPDDKLKLEGAVDAYSPGLTITVLGIEYGLDIGTRYDPSPPVFSIGDIVEIEDEDDPPGSADGIADEVELREDDEDEGDDD